MADRFDEMKDDASEAMDEHSDRARDGMQAGADKADDMTGGRYGDTIDKGHDAASDKLDEWDSEQ
jgi:hypothetical protein